MIESTLRVWRLMAGSRLQYAVSIGAMGVATVFLYLAPLVPQATIDGVLAPSPEPGALVTTVVALLGGRDVVAANLWLPGLVVVALTAVAGGFTYLRGRWSAQASEDITRRLRDRVYDHLQRLPASYFDEADTGDLLQRCTSDVETVRLFLANHVAEIGRAVFLLLVPLPVMLAIDVRMTVIAVLLVPMITASTTVFFVKLRAGFERKDAAEGELTAVVQENLTGIRVVRAFSRQEHEIARFAEKNQRHRDLDDRLYRLMAWFWAGSDVMTFVQQFLVVGAGVILVSRGELAVGGFFYFLTAVGMFVFPLRQMGRIVADLGKATVALERLTAILDAEREDPDGRVVGRLDGEIALEDVHFTYPDGTVALRGVDLRIPPRSTVAFVGPSGSGKSTIIALLLRLYEPQRGAIRLDGTALDTLERASLRRRIAVVMQQPFLFSKTLLDNLRLGRSSATRAEVEQAAVCADLHATILGFDHGYETAVGERGVTLSGGQRQRVAIARALLKEPDILVLDDALSAVDAHTETTILSRLAPRRGRYTTILVAHRLSTVALADLVFVLDKGRVVEQGTHRGLLAGEGAYARLWRLQTEDAGRDELPETFRPTGTEGPR